MKKLFHRRNMHISPITFERTIRDLRTSHKDTINLPRACRVIASALPARAGSGLLDFVEVDYDRGLSIPKIGCHGVCRAYVHLRPVTNY